MLTDLKFWVDLAGVVMEVILLAYFMHVMFGPMRCPRYVGIVVYMILGGCLMAISYGVEQAYGRTILYFFVIAIVIAPFYEGKIWSKIFTGVCFVLISGLLEYIVHGFLMSIAGEVYATGKNNLQDYVLGLSVSKCLLLILIQALSEWVKRTNKQKGQLSRQNFFLLLGFPIVTIGAFFVLYYAFISRNDSQGIFLLLAITILFLMADIGIFVLFNRLTEAARLEQELSVSYTHLLGD